MQPIDPIALTTEEIEILLLTGAFSIVAEINSEIAQLNTLITAYNQSSTDEERRNKLIALYQTYQSVDSHYPPAILHYISDYSAKIHHQLFSAIAKEATALNMVFSGDTLRQRTSKKRAATASAATLIANMTTDALRHFINALMAEDYQGALASGTIEDPNYQQWIAHYSIEKIGQGNTSIYLIKNKDNATDTFILKVECNRDSPYQLEAQLRQKGAPFTIPYARRQLMTSNGMITLTLTDFCSQGSLEQVREKLGSKKETVITTARSYFSQIIDALTLMQTEQTTYTDLKNANLLVTSDNRIKVGDCKSLAHSQAGQLNYYDLSKDKTAQAPGATYANRWVGNHISRHTIAPECKRSMPGGVWTSPIAVEPMHAYMLGMCLYQYLSHYPDKDLEKINDGEKPFDFSLELFTSSAGKQLKILIENLTKEDPAERLSLGEAKLALALLDKTEQERATAKECVTLLTTFQALGIGEDDVMMNNFISEQRQLILTAAEQSPAELAKIKRQLEVTRDAITPHVQALKAIISRLKKEDGLFNRAGAKANRIEKALKAVPIAARNLEVTKEGDQLYALPSVIAVLNALGEHQSKVSFSGGPARAVEEYRRALAEWQRDPPTSGPGDPSL